MITIDFETEAIDGNPLVAAPAPVGVAICADGEAPFYTDDWGVLERYWNSGDDLLFHNAPFDLSVASQHLGLVEPPWESVHDTMYSVFLANPYARSLGLKQSAESYLNVPPDEQDELHQWIVANVPEATKRTAGAYISRAPEELVSKYAIGDIVRTRQLHDHLMPTTPTEPYDRERRLAPILMEGTRKGVRIDRERLGADIEMYEAAMHKCRDMLIAKLGCGDSINLDSNDEFADALDKAGLVTEWVLTPTGKRSVSKPNLINSINDPEVLDLFLYHSTLGTCLGTFMLPWYAQSEADGRVHPSWNAVRNMKDHSARGTRTGRLSSSSPNFQNVPNAFGQPIPTGLPPLPQMRVYCLPEPGHVWVKRDFSSQEIRIAAHYENSALMQAYVDDPDFDPHEMARQIILEKTGLDYARKNVKITAFGIIYGMGVPALSSSLNVPPTEAATLKAAYLNAVPGIAKLSAATKKRGLAGLPIHTWGGRPYLPEPSKVIGGRKRDFSYKLLNYLIQGSAADQTKQCICDWYEDYKSPDDIFLATVHDEINISVPAEDVVRGMDQLRKAMEQDLFDVPMRSEGFVGKNWQDIEEVK